MLVRFWGTRGSIAKAGPSTVRYGGNTSCVEVRSQAGTLLVIDCGTGAHGLGMALMDEPVQPLQGHLLISHTHWDHIQGIPFFAPLREASNRWDIYAPQSLSQSIRDTLAGQMQYSYFPISLESLGAQINYHDIVEGVFDAGDIKVRTCYLNHPALTLGYRLEADGFAIVYSCDHEQFAHHSDSADRQISEQDRRHAEFVRDADLVIHDAQYLAVEYPEKVGWGHSTAEFAVDLCGSVGVKQLALTHHDPMRDDDAVDRVVAAMQDRVRANGHALKVFAAAEGGSIDLGFREHAAAADDGAGFSAITPVSAMISAAVMSEYSILLGALQSDTAAVLKAAAELEGIRVLSACDTSGALQLLDSQQPSVFIFDQQLVAGDVPELCRRAANSAHKGPHHAVTVVLVTDGDEGLPELSEFALDWVRRGFSIEYARTRIRAWVLQTTCRWVRASLPTQEEARLAALQAAEILDTEPEERFDRIVRIASETFNVPIALVSLVDRDRQWFKSGFGLQGKETPRDMAFCAHAVVSEEMLIVPDALLDPRFADNPLVTGDPRIRFYAGCPLRLAGGSIAGTLCVIDTRPRQLDERQQGLLRDLGTLVEAELLRGPESVLAREPGL